MYICKKCGGKVLAVTQDIHERGYYISKDMKHIGACIDYRDRDVSYIFKCWSCGNANKEEFTWESDGDE